jgi:hypothetical protein
VPKVSCGYLIPVLLLTYVTLRRVCRVSDAWRGMRWRCVLPTEAELMSWWLTLSLYGFPPDWYLF